MSRFDIESIVLKYNLSLDERKILESLEIDSSQRECISQYDQRTDQWLQCRKFRLTASRFGAARGHCQYTSRSELLKSMLWDDKSIGNAATEWGVKHESVAVNIYTKFMKKYKNLSDSQFRVTHCGLLVSLEYPWIGVSVDAFVFDDSEPEGRKNGGGEIKCPFGKKLYAYIPSQYYDQIQGSMGFLHKPWWDFVVWTPTQTQIRRFNFDMNYFSTELFPRLEKFYMTEFLPRAVQKLKGLLKPGYIDPVIEIPVDVPLTAGKEEDSAKRKNDESISHINVQPDKYGRYDILLR